MDVFPVTESTLSALHLESFLQKVYRLSPKTKCKLFRTGMNHLYLVTDGESKFVFRIYTHNWRGKVDISEEIRLLLHLKENDLPISYPLVNDRREYIQEMNAPEGIRYGVLFSFAEGEKVSKLTASMCYQIGIVMGKMHRSTEDFKLDRITYNTRTLLSDSLNRTKSFFTNPSEETAFVERATSYLIKEYQKVNFNAVRQGAVHLDLWFDNMHIKEEDSITIFDFDFCGNGWLCYDIAYFLFQLYSTSADVQEYESKAKRFIEGYESITTITEEEKQLIPLTSLGVLLFYLSIQCDRYDIWSNIFLNEDHLKRFVASLKRWAAYHQLAID